MMGPKQTSYNQRISYYLDYKLPGCFFLKHVKCKMKTREKIAHKRHNLWKILAQVNGPPVNVEAALCCPANERNNTSITQA